MDQQDLEHRLDALERRVERRWRRRLIGVLAVGIIVAIAPAIVLASHQFTDVPTSYIFHGDIDHVYDARVTNGCTATTYCPDDPVSRGQMAAFLNRVGGRVTYDTNGYQFNLATEKELAAVTIRAGNVPGGVAFVKLDASYFGYTNSGDETLCVPCTAIFSVRWTEGGVSSLPSYVTATNTSATIQEIESGSITWVVQVPTGVDQTFRLTGLRGSGGAGFLNALGSLAATYYPFGGLGADTLSSASAPVAMPADLTPTAPTH